LDAILATKREEIAAAKRDRPIDVIRSLAAAADPPRDFFRAVATSSPTGPRLIAEIKKRSPSAGLIREDFDPAAIARIYEGHGASAISVLTDRTYFDGRLEHIQKVKEVVGLPVLRKDFILDEYQIFEARAAGADALLLIAEALDVHQVAELLAISLGLAMHVLIEVHDEANLRALLETVGPPGEGQYILGINNRDLTVQRTDLATTARLAKLVPVGSPLVSESGISTRADVLSAGDAGATAVLVGESILREADLGAKVDGLLGRP
jgi:indole-3-glycerol phosphate synthase